MHSENYLINECYDRIILGKPFNKKFKPYTKEFMKKVLLYFEEKEEFEKCKTLIDFMNIKYNHDIGYTL
jgi:hypothetical protein